MNLIRQIKAAVLGEFAPDLIVYLDIDPQLGLARAVQRGELDRIEQEQLSFFERTRASYLALATDHEQCEIVDASQSEAQVKAAVLACLERRLCTLG